MPPHLGQCRFLTTGCLTWLHLPRNGSCFLMISVSGFYNPLWFGGRQKQKLESARLGFSSLWLVISGAWAHLWPTHLISQCFHMTSAMGSICIWVLNYQRSPVCSSPRLREGTKTIVLFCFVPVYGDSHQTKKLCCPIWCMHQNIDVDDNKTGTNKETKPWHLCLSFPMYH